MATLIIEHSRTTGSDRLGEILRDHGHHLDVIFPAEGDPIPQDLGGIDAIVACGGPHAPDDEELTWLEPQKHLLRQAHEESLPVVGICLGSQILASALGGHVF